MPFRDIIGHRRLVDLVARSIRRGTLPPSLLLAGPEGVGKRLLALSTAQALNCQSPRTAEPDADPKRVGLQPLPLETDACGACQACSKIARGIHPDVIVIEPGDTGTIKIDSIRDVIDRAGYRPFEGRRRVVIIDQADALVPQAQNALLKTLEEPPSASVFLLVTSRPDSLLPTVVSRCPRLRFRLLDADDVARVLIKQGRSEASGEDLVEARHVAGRVLAQVAAGDDARSRLQGAQALLPRTSAGGAADREHLAVNLRAMASLLRDAEVVATRATTTLANPDVRADIERLSVFQGERGVRAFTAVDQALEALERNAGVKTVADWLVLQL